MLCTPKPNGKWSLSLLNGYNWEYTLFSDKPKCWWNVMGKWNGNGVPSGGPYKSDETWDLSFGLDAYSLLSNDLFLSTYMTHS